MFATPDNFLFDDLDLSGLCQVHRLYDHHFQVTIGDRITLQVKQEIMTFHIAAISEIHAEVKLHAKFRLRIGRIHSLADQLQAGGAIFHQFNGIPIRVGDPGLAGIVHAERDGRNFHPFAF